MGYTLGVMSKFTRIDLTHEQRAALETGWRQGECHAFRQRCRMILLKSQGLTARQVAAQLDCCAISVHGWCKRYLSAGINGLQTQPGRGRKAILQADTDLEAVKAAVQAHRQRLKLAKADLESALGKEFSLLTLKRFLKNITAATNDCENA